MPALSELTARRPTRADARRNYDRLIVAGRALINELGTEAPLEEIARRAEVGIGTLYRNFATRDALIEAIYVDDVILVCEAAADVADLPAWDALIAWLNRFIVYAGNKRALLAGMNRASDVFRICREYLHAAGGPLLERAQQAGIVRTDTDIDDVMRLVTGLTAVTFASEAQRDKVLAMALDGLKVTAI